MKGLPDRRVLLTGNDIPSPARELSDTTAAGLWSNRDGQIDTRGFSDLSTECPDAVSGGSQPDRTSRKERATQNGLG